MADRRPHVVIFNPDSWRGDVLAHLGNPSAVTPHLDAMVRDAAVSYANAFAQNPVCTPSRCSFITGQYPHVRGHRSMKHMMRSHEPHLLKVLMREGYHVWWGGKNDLAAVASPEDYLQHCHVRAGKTTNTAVQTRREVGPDDPRYAAYYRGVIEGHDGGWPFADQDGRWVRQAVDHIAQHDADAQSLCVFLPLSNPHPPYRVEKEFYDWIDPSLLPARLPSPARDWAIFDAMRQQLGSDGLGEEDWREIRRVYYAMCAKVDALFGQVVAALKAKGIYDDTLIIFMSDHGDFTGDYGLVEKTHFSLQDNLLRVPLIIKPPAFMPVRPGVRQSLVELVDICPTIYDLLAIKPGYDTQGVSLRQHLAGEDAPLREAVFAEVGARRGEAAFLNLDSLAMPETSFYFRQATISLSMHEQGSYAVMARTKDWKLVRRPYLKHDELYDLNADAGELHNLAGLPEHAEVQRRMNHLMLDHFLRTADVLPHDQDRRGV